MNFFEHSNLEGKHAFLSPSKYHWINYTPEKMEETFRKAQATQKGTELHELAAKCIGLGVKLPKSEKTLNAFVNDAIGFRMKPEQPLFYSEFCFGTTDAISFRKRFLRIHDLKTGETPTSFYQLMVYTALFCLEYKESPNEIEIELRLYQSDGVQVLVPNPEDVQDIMKKIVSFDARIREMLAGG